jgi:hypothetical protein
MHNTCGPFPFPNKPDSPVSAITEYYSHISYIQQNFHLQQCVRKIEKRYNWAEVISLLSHSSTTSAHFFLSLQEALKIKKQKRYLSFSATTA